MPVDNKEKKTKSQSVVYHKGEHIKNKIKHYSLLLGLSESAFFTMTANDWIQRYEKSQEK